MSGRHERAITTVTATILSVVLLIVGLAGGYTIGTTLQLPRGLVVSESAVLAGLAAGALFPFIDTTPKRIVIAHIAVTDETSSCAAGAAAPTNIQVLAGQAGVSLVNVMTAATNTGIGSATQCVFHVTLTPGAGGVPGTVTDIVVVNTGDSTLTGVNTVTVSAEVSP